jgi:hypothetical protein
MDAGRFAAFLAALAAPSRRVALRLLGGLGLAGLIHPTEARKKKRKKKKCARAGQPTRKKRKKCCPGLAKDATGLCAAPCTPATCPPSTCGSVPDGCGGSLSCGCSANELCLNGACQPCTVTCTGSAAACGASLQAALNGGGTVYVCPGNYRGGFVLNAAMRVVGAGEGTDPATNTILDANDRGRVLEIKPGVGPVELERLRITDGNISQGAGVLHSGTKLVMTDCTASGNTAIGNVALGGGIASGPGILEMTRCAVRDNHAIGMGGQFPAGQGGGMFLVGTTTLTDCLIEDNRATVEGGGLWIGSGAPQPAAILTGSTKVRDNAAEFGAGIVVYGTLTIAETCRVTENTASAPGNGGGIYSFGAAAVTLQGTAGTTSPIVVDNCHENCVGNVPLCAATPVSCPP